jgi:hypothetical protein
MLGRPQRMLADVRARRIERGDAPPQRRHWHLEVNDSDRWMADPERVPVTAAERRACHEGGPPRRARDLTGGRSGARVAVHSWDLQAMV